jgi:hypothetical protein
MTYNINKSDGLPLVTIQDNSIDTTSTSLTLFGRNVLNYGQAENQNFVNLLQNFANKTSPANPLQGQLWYDTTLERLRVYTTQWTVLEPPFDGTSGTATVRIGPNQSSVAIVIVNNRIVSVSSYVALSPALLPDSVVVSDTRYFFKSVFPNGIKYGVNLATDIGVGYQFFGNATSSNVLATARTINLTGELAGSTLFDGSSNVVIEARFSNLYIGNTNVTVSGTYTKIVVNDGGRIIGGGNIANSDIVNALGYVPYSGANINVAAQGNTVVARDENGNFAANIITGTSTSAFALKNPIMIGINGDVVGAASFDGSNSIVISTQLAPVSNLIAGTYSTVRVDTKGRVVSGSITGDAPVGGIIVYNNPVSIPAGWAKCDGKSYTSPLGDVVTTPNLSNVVIGASSFYIMKIY